MHTEQNHQWYGKIKNKFSKLAPSVDVFHLIGQFECYVGAIIY